MLERFVFLEARKVGNLVDCTTRLVHEKLKTSDKMVSFLHREVVGSLMYLAKSTRAVISFAVGFLSRFVNQPSDKHVGAVKRVRSYLASTLNYGLTYQSQYGSTSRIVIDGFSDSYWGGDPDTRRSVTGVVLNLAGGAVSWLSRLQSVVALSTDEGEYIATNEETMEAASLRNIVEETLYATNKSIAFDIGVDKSSAMTLAMDLTFSRLTHHIELRWHYVREQVKKIKINLHKVRTYDNTADLLTKATSADRVQNLIKCIGITDALK